MANRPSRSSDLVAVAAACAPVDESPETAEEREIAEARWAEYVRTGAAVAHAEVMQKIAERKRNEGD